MDSKEAIKIAIDTGDMVCMSYVGDLTDQELMQRPHAECNHLNWQLGHLISSEHEMIEMVAPGSMPALPAGFAAQYTRENAKENDPSKFATKEVLMATYKAQRAGTLAALANMTDEQLSKPTGVNYAPTVGAMFSMQGGHWLMHCGQWVVVRRALGKPVVI